MKQRFGKLSIEHRTSNPKEVWLEEGNRYVAFRRAGAHWIPTITSYQVSTGTLSLIHAVHTFESPPPPIGFRNVLDRIRLQRLFKATDTTTPPKNFRSNSLYGRPGTLT